jgi:hypothetical protein
MMQTRYGAYGLAQLVWLIAVMAALSLSACADSAEQMSVPTRTRRPYASPTATRTRPPVILAARANFTPAPGATATPRPVCSPLTISSGEHISASGSYTTTEDQAAGPMVCRIERGSCAFRRLVGNLDSEILFNLHKAPPFDTEDQLMHPSMLLPLSRLRDLVAAEWDGSVQLMVSAAYDSLLEHDLAQANANRKYSLHFEGRSLDLVTYPIDSSRYSRLCALARCAGFDWVNNEGDHCHVSLKAQSLCTVCSGKAP